MRIVIDMQGAQTESRYRGIGRYTVAFTKAVIRNRGKHEVILVLNGLFPDTIESLRAEFEGLLPQENIRVWYAPGPVKDDNPKNRTRRDIAELVREAFLASLNPDIIHVTSLFEGYIDDAVVGIGKLDQKTPVSCMLYDLIPLLNAEQYLQPRPCYAAYYTRKLESLKNADLLFAISAYSRQEGVDLLDQGEDGIINVSTAIGPEFKQIEIDAAAASSLYKTLGITRSFILYTGGGDERKNLPRLVEAYAGLPGELRSAYQLVLAGRISADEIRHLQGLAEQRGLEASQLIFTSYISDDYLVQLYNLCSLFVFPSWHEGFGLPALEAMACGAAVIGANTSSLPEVIGLDEALFDPFNVVLFSKKMAEALNDKSFSARLRAHGLLQARKFSWTETASRAIKAWESLYRMKRQSSSLSPRASRKPRLAYVSPMPPERTGVADYSAELLPALSEYYDIELVIAQEKVQDSWAEQNANVRDEAWLRANAADIDRVLYQMGNSPFHWHMLRLLEDIPGTVVLHDFYASGLMSWLEIAEGQLGVWTKALYDSHGYSAVRKRFSDTEEAIRVYPVNWGILQHAQAVIVHSGYARRLAQQWYGPDAATDWEEIPLLRLSENETDKRAARKELGIDADEFVVCSFGFLDRTKLNHRLLEVWLTSDLARDKRTTLYFVGESHSGEYGSDLLKTIRDNGMSDRIHITGFTSKKEFKLYLTAADLAVQLRMNSRGETSAAVLDCMNHSLPVIVNANGAIAELDSQAVWMLPDEFSDAALKDALHSLWTDPKRRHALGERARNIILSRHNPTECARRYSAVIECSHRRTISGPPTLIQALVNRCSFEPSDTELLQLSQAVATNHPMLRPARRLFLDITATSRNDIKTGVERVTRALMMVLLELPPAGYRIEPVYLSEINGVWHHRYARNYTMDLLNCPTGVLTDEPVDAQNGDLMVTLDISGDSLIRAEQSGLFAFYRNQGVAVYSIVHDLLPIHMPEVFPPGAFDSHTQWLQAVSAFDGAICVSASVARDLKAWLRERQKNSQGRRNYHVGYCHLGADVSRSAPSTGFPDNGKAQLHQLASRPSFLMVGTIEPRKGHQCVIDAFDQLWAEGVEVNLVIVGQEGWKGLSDQYRRDIPQTVERVRTHPLLGKRLFWLEGISDEYLEQVYSTSTCLIAASYGEGFGLPLIEAAQHKLPIIARDIPVFREVAGKHAHYFDASTADELAESVKTWLSLYKTRNHPKSDDMPWLTWRESATQLLSIVTDDAEETRTKTSNAMPETPNISLEYIQE